MGNLNFVVGKPLLEVKSTATGEVYIPPVTLTVSFNSNGGNAPSFLTKQVMHTGTYGMLPQVTRTNYKFKGWYTSTSGGSRIDAGSIVNNPSNHTLYAQWLPRFLVTFQYKDGQGVDQTYSEYVFQGENANPPDTPSREYWEFNGWTPSFFNIQSQTTVTANYLPRISGYYISPTSTVNLEYGAMQTFSVVKRESSLPNPSSYSWLSGGDLNLATITGNATSAFKITNNNTTTSEGYIGSISTSINVSGLIFSLSFSGVVNLLRQRFTITTNAFFTDNNALNYTISTQQVFRGVTPVLPQPSIQYWYVAYLDTAVPATSNATYNVYYSVYEDDFFPPSITSSESPMGTGNFTIQNANETAVSVSYTIYRLVNYQRDSVAKSGTFNLASLSSSTISHTQNTNTYLEIEVEFKYQGVGVGISTRTQWVQQPVAVKQWQYMTYVSSEPEYGTYNFIVYRSGATTQTQAKSILDAEFPASGYSVGSVAVITPDYAVYWIFEVVQ